MKTLDHNNIVSYLDHSLRPPQLVLEYVSRGSLISVLRSDVLTWAQCLTLSDTFISGRRSLRVGLVYIWGGCGLHLGWGWFIIWGGCGLYLGWVQFISGMGAVYIWGGCGLHLGGCGLHPVMS